MAAQRERLAEVAAVVSGEVEAIGTAEVVGETVGKAAAELARVTLQ